MFWTRQRAFSEETVNFFNLVPRCSETIVFEGLDGSVGAAWASKSGAERARAAQSELGRGRKRGWSGQSQVCRPDPEKRAMESAGTQIPAAVCKLPFRATTLAERYSNAMT